jgi:hypothetical protein
MPLFSPPCRRYPATPFSVATRRFCPTAMMLGRWVVAQTRKRPIRTVQISKRRARVVQISKRRLRALQIGKLRIRPSVSGGKPPKTHETGRPGRFGSQRRNVRQARRGHCETEGSYAAQPWKRFAAKRCRGTRSWPRAAEAAASAGIRPEDP